MIPREGAVTRRAVLCAALCGVPVARVASAQLPLSPLQEDVAVIAEAEEFVLAELSRIPDLTVPPEIGDAIKKNYSDINRYARQIERTRPPPSPLMEAFAVSVSAMVPLTAPFFSAAPNVAKAVMAGVTLAQYRLHEVSPLKATLVFPDAADRAREFLNVFGTKPI